MKSSVKIAAALLALLIAVAVFAACAEKTGPAEESTTAAAVTNDVPATAAAETKPVPDLPETKWDREFRILGCGETASETYPSFELYAEDLNGEVMNDAVFKRNETIKDKYGITVVQTLEKKTQDRVTKDASSGEDSFDLVFVYISKVGGLAQKGYFRDLNNVDYIDFEKPWWHKNVNDVVSVKGHIYYTSSDFSLRDKNRVQVIVCNDALRDELRLDPIPNLVRSNEWVAEKMSQYVTAAASDLNGDGKMTKEDRFGLTMSSYDDFAALCFGCGLRLIGKDDSDGLAIVENLDRSSEAVDAALDICRKEVMMTPEEYGRDWDVSDNTFVDGRALFTMCSLHYVGYHGRTCEFDFTVVPSPKLNADQENFCTMPEISCMFFAIPTTNQDPDFAGFALEAFSYESTDTTYVTFIELYCKSRNVRNADSVEMVNIILNNIVYDSSVFYSESIPLYNIINTIIPTTHSNTFLRNVNSNRSRAQTEIDRINSAFSR